MRRPVEGVRVGELIGRLGMPRADQQRVQSQIRGQNEKTTIIDGHGGTGSAAIDR